MFGCQKNVFITIASIECYNFFLKSIVENLPKNKTLAKCVFYYKKLKDMYFDNGLKTLKFKV